MKTYRVSLILHDCGDSGYDARMLTWDWYHQMGKDDVEGLIGEAEKITVESFTELPYPKDWR